MLQNLFGAIIKPSNKAITSKHNKKGRNAMLSYRMNSEKKSIRETMIEEVESETENTDFESMSILDFVPV